METAEALELNSISFLAADIESPAFNRPEGWDALRRERVTLDRPQVPVLADQVSRLIAGRTATLADTHDHLNRIVDIFRLGTPVSRGARPSCNAPWVSAVLDSAGAVSPCFFHRPFARVGIGLAPALNAPAALRFRTTLDVAADETSQILRLFAKPSIAPDREFTSCLHIFCDTQGRSGSPSAYGCVRRNVAFGIGSHFFRAHG